ncbi:MAG TPA: nuclear transport factor 2 family protein [Pyrinomonadaceae bacterium]|jgi:ketosteroid isomerase-like protein|nr:nuclear transport factor 2 family protein [Pyrinomonadaceae bacterium]
MKHLAIRLIVSLFTFAIGIASVSLLHASRPHAVSNSKDEQAILQIEHQYIQANLNADTATLNNILADDFTIRSRRGFTTKAERLALLESPDFAFKAINTDNVAVEVNGDMATVTGEASIETRHYDVEFTSPTYRFTRNYEKRDGHWQIVSVIVRR